ncbi:MAG: AtpZ/AtpI family protein [Candidatus Pristimantibacillus sp.]
MNHKNRRDNPLIAAGLVGALGVQVAICIFLGYWIGSYLDRHFDTGSGWTIGGILFGMAVGLISAVLIVKKVLEDSNG